MTPQERTKKYEAELARLREAFAGADPAKAMLFDANIIEQARLRVEIDELSENVNKYGPVRVSKKDPTKQKSTEAARQLIRLRAALNNNAKLLSKELLGVADDDDNGLDDYE